MQHNVYIMNHLTQCFVT